MERTETQASGGPLLAGDVGDDALRLFDRAVTQLLYEAFGLLRRIDIQRSQAEGSRNLGSDGLIHRTISS
jgi:hypothetical protein